MSTLTSHLETLLPAGKELLTANDLIAAGLYDTVGQIQRAVDSQGLPGLRLSFRTTKFPRAAIIEWLTTQMTQPKKRFRKNAQDETAPSKTEHESSSF